MSSFLNLVSMGHPIRRFCSGCESPSWLCALVSSATRRYPQPPRASPVPGAVPSCGLAGRPAGEAETRFLKKQAHVIPASPLGHTCLGAARPQDAGKCRVYGAGASESKTYESDVNRGPLLPQPIAGATTSFGVDPCLITCLIIRLIEPLEGLVTTVSTTSIGVLCICR